MLRNNCPCDIDGVCPYDAQSWNTCDWYCGEPEPQDDPETWNDEDEMTDAEFESAVASAAAMACGREFWEEKRCT